MPQQLIFTSAVRGITPGSSGYCTIARSVEMREGLVSRLEQLSVYQHQQQGANPMVLSHRILSLRGTIFHVLSRIVDAGLDYTNRTNFIAHHVVFQPHELHAACSPADYLLNWTGWLSSWEGDPKWTDDQLASPHRVQTSCRLPAEYWAGWSGNAGNAALLFDADKARDTALLVEPGQESSLIYLFSESILLLGANSESNENQWQVPFTTFFQSKDEVGDFRWRGGWPDLNRAKTERGAVVLDLRNPSGFPPAKGPLAEWALTGIAPRPITAELAPIESNNKDPQDLDKPTSTITSEHERRNKLIPSVRKKQRPEQVVVETDEVSETWFWKWRWALLGGFTVTLLLLMGSVVLFFTLTEKRHQDEDISSRDNLALPGHISSDSQDSASSGKMKSTQPPTNNPETDVITRFLDAPKTNNSPVPANTTNSTGVATPSVATNNSPLLSASPSTNGIVSPSTPTTNSPSLTTMAKGGDQVALTFPEGFPTGDVYILFRNASTIDTTPIPPELDSRLASRKSTDEYFASTTGFGDVAKCYLTAGPDEYVLKLLGKPIAKYKPGSISGTSDPFYLKIKKGNETISLIMVDVSKTTGLFTLSRSFLNLSDGDISANEELKSRVSRFFAYYVYVSTANSIVEKPLNLQFILVANNKSSFSDTKAFSISWKQAEDTAKENWTKDKAKFDGDKKKSQTEALVKSITFGSLEHPLLLTNNDTSSFSAFLQSRKGSDVSSKTPPLVQYAKHILSSIGTIHFTGDLKLEFDDPQNSNDWSGWFKKVAQELPNKLLPGPAEIHDDEKDSFKSSLNSLCNQWSTTFTSPDASQLLTTPPEAIIESLGSIANLDADQKQLNQDEENQKPISKDNISAVGVIVTPASSSSVQVIQFEKGNYNTATQSTQGVAK